METKYHFAAPAANLNRTVEIEPAWSLSSVPLNKRTIAMKQQKKINPLLPRQGEKERGP